MTGWFFVPFAVAILIYWGATYWATRMLPNERRRLGDPRPVPDLLDPLTSHRWLPILLGEKTREFRPQARRAFTVARIALLLTPVAFFASIVLAANVPDASGSQIEGEQGAPLPVMLPIPD